MMSSSKQKRSMKLYPHGTLTDTEIRMEEKKTRIKVKWNSTLLLEEKIIPKKGNSHERRIVIVNGEPEVHESCVKCEEWKPLYDYFTRANFMDLPSSKEYINNDIKSPCRQCCKHTRHEKMKNNQEAYITRLLYNYPKLTKDWYQQQITKNGGLFSSISGIPLADYSSGCWQVSIQNNRRDLEHLPEYCEIIALEENIPQHEAIPDLTYAFTALYTNMVQNIVEPDSIEEQQKFSKIWEDRYSLTPRQSGVELKSRTSDNKISAEYDKEVRQKHLKSMFTSDTKAAVQHDKKSKRILNKADTRIKGADMFNIGKKQEWRCYKSGIKLCMNRNSWNYPSLERLDNKVNHTLENTVLICRLLNTTDIAQWTTPKLYHALQHQKLVTVPDEARSKIIELLKTPSQ